MRRGRRLALRHPPRRASRRTSQTSTRRSRSSSSTSWSGIARSGFVTSPPTTRRVAELDGIEPLAREREGDTHAHHLYVVRIDAERAGATRDEYQQALDRREHRHEHPLPAGAPPHVLPRALPGPGVAARRRARGRRGAVAAALACALGRRHPGRDRRAAPGARALHGAIADGSLLTAARPDRDQHRALGR